MLVPRAANRGAWINAPLLHLPPSAHARRLRLRRNHLLAAEGDPPLRARHAHHAGPAPWSTTATSTTTTPNAAMRPGSRDPDKSPLEAASHSCSPQFGRSQSIQGLRFLVVGTSAKPQGWLDSR